MKRFFLKVREDYELEKLMFPDRSRLGCLYVYLYIVSWSAFWSVQCWLFGHDRVEDVWVEGMSHCRRCGDTLPDSLE